MLQFNASNNELSVEYYNELIETKTRTVIFLLSSVRLQGFVLEQDFYTITLGLGDHVQLVNKHAIGTIAPWNEAKHDSWNNKKHHQ